MSKVIVDKAGKEVKYSFNDDEEVIVEEKTIRIPNNPLPKVIGNVTYTGGTVICDLNENNAEVIEGVTLPVDFEAYNYTYDTQANKFTKGTIRFVEEVSL